MRRRQFPGLAAALGAALAGAVSRAQQPAVLTAMGAQRAGNAAGSIPAYDGGLVSPPPGWRPEQGYTDPFAAERPHATVTAANLSAHQELLSPGLVSLLRRQPAFRMPVYPCHRTATWSGAVPGGPPPVPYPVPRDGLEAIANHLLRPLGGGVARRFDTFVVRATGEPIRIGFEDERIYDAHFDQPMADRLFSYRGRFLSPEDLVGTLYLVHEPHPLRGQERKAWVYNSGQRRVRRAPDLAYDNAQDGTDSLAVVDQYDGYNGRPDRYDWQLLGKRELLVSYNNYAIGDKRVPYGQVLTRGSPNPALLRFEPHRVWVVEARLKPGQNHLYARRVFYLDEDSWSVLVSEAYDARGQLWRLGLHGLVQYYDAGVSWYRYELWFDLSNDSYVLTGLDNAYPGVWRFGLRGRMQDFQPDALRRAGH